MRLIGPVRGKDGGACCGKLYRRLQDVAEENRWGHFQLSL